MATVKLRTNYVVRGYKQPKTGPSLATRARTTAVSKAKPLPAKAFKSAKTNFPKMSEFKRPTGYQHVLMAEMFTAFAIIGIRALADYVPNNDVSMPGSEKPNKGQSPIVLIASTLIVYFVLSFFATRGEWPARVSAAFGLLMIFGLLVNSSDELSQIADWAESLKGNSASQPPPPTQGTSGGGNATNSPPGTGPQQVPSSGPGSSGQPLF